MQSYDDEVVERRPRTWLRLLILAIAAFAAGLAAAGYLIAHDRRTAGILGLAPAADLAAARQAATQHFAAAQPVAATSPTTVPPTDNALATRVDTLEGRLNDIEDQARAATGDASRAEGLLVAFAARRALDRGTQLGYIEGLLRQRFGGTQPQAVAAILSASRTPVTLADLETGLDAIAPDLASGGQPQASWWQAFRQELATMVVVRRAGEPSTQPADRVARAQRMLEAGQVDGALAEIARLPDHSAADRWIVAARRYLGGRGALDQIETAALLDPAIETPGPPPVAAPAPHAVLPAPVPAPVPAPTK